MANLTQAQAIASCRKTRRQAFDPASAFVVKLGETDFPINLDVSPDDCETISGFTSPSKGAFRRKFVFLMACLMNSIKPIWVWGPPGIGKDYNLRAWSALTRTPCQTYQIRSDVDVQNEWMYERAFNSDGTYIKYNALWRDLTEGRHGKPMTIIFSDFDRATRDQIAVLRSVLDSDSPFLTGPNGDHVKIFPGTRILVTANSGGMGDERGLCTDAMTIDSSIMDRFTFPVRFPQLEWVDEERMIAAKYPEFATTPGWIEALKGMTEAIRAAVKNGDLYMEFSHRGVQGLCEFSMMARSVYPNDSSKALRFAVREWIEGTTPDEDTQLAVKRLCDPHLQGGALETED
jgi:MoxR-like ATPase